MGMRSFLQLSCLLVQFSHIAASDRDDKCLLRNMDLVERNLITVRGVTSTFNCVDLCLIEPGCEAVVWITRTETCLVKGSSPGARLSASTWIASSLGGAGVVVFMSCLEADQVAMESIEEAERRKNAEVEAADQVIEGENVVVNEMELGNYGEMYDEAGAKAVLTAQPTVRNPTETLDKVTVRNPTETFYEATVRKPTETLYKGTVRKPTKTLDKVTVRNPTETFYEATVRKPTETLYKGTVRKPTKTLDQGTVRKPTETLYEDTARKPTETLDEDTARKPTETLDEDTVRKPTETLDEGTVRKEYTPKFQYGQDHHESRYPMEGWWNNPYNTFEWVRAVFEPVFSWWSWGSSPEEEDASAATVPSSLPTFSNSPPTLSSSPSSFSSSQSSFSNSPSSFSSSSSTNSTSSSDRSSSGVPHTDLTSQNKLLRIIETVGNWTVSAMQDIFTALGKAATNYRVEEEEMECEDSAKSCNKQLCGVEVVRNMCKKTCRICPGKQCKNMYSDKYCSLAAQLGQCDRAEVAAKCSYSCGSCPDLEPCRDVDVQFCKRYGKFHCWNEEVREMCSKSCFLC
ncbi:hypothetical protein ACHWQZ_G000750 [Mnemiopsis leidyi]